MRYALLILAFAACSGPKLTADEPEAMECADVNLHGSGLSLRQSVAHCENEKAECYLASSGISCRWK